MIDKLTKEQRNKLAEYKSLGNKWGLSTERIDQGRAREAVNLAYKKAELDLPKEIVFADSPIAAWEKVGKAESPSISMGVSVHHFVGNTVAKAVCGCVGEVIRDSVKQSVWLPLWECSGKCTERYIGLSLRLVTWQFDNYWAAWTQYYRDMFDLPDLDKADGLIATIKECGAVAMLKDIAIVSDRPLEIHLDAEGRWHNEDGAAVLYPDGWSIYAEHGMPVDRK